MKAFTMGAMLACVMGISVAMAEGPAAAPAAKDTDKAEVAKPLAPVTLTGKLTKVEEKKKDGIKVYYTLVTADKSRGVIYPDRTSLSNVKLADFVDADVTVIGEATMQENSKTWKFSRVMEIRKVEAK